MSYMKSVDGKPVPMTDEEVAQRQAEEAAWESGRASREAAAHNAKIDAELAENDLKVIRALIEGDSARIEAHKAKQAELRAKRK